MKRMIETDFDMKVNISSSWIIYITKTWEDACVIMHSLHETSMMLKENGWYYTTSACEVLKDCRVPEFFHERGYFMVAIEHNRGNWELEPEYKLFLVE